MYFEYLLRVRRAAVANIVSREVGANEAAVVTIGVLQAGTKEKVIPDEAVITLDSYSLVTNDPEMTKRVRDAFRLHFPAFVAAAQACLNV